MNLFSVGIPVFKGKFLKECLYSIINQSYNNFEIIIVNDASPDNIDVIIEEFNDKRIKYYKNEKNTGAENVVDNWNKCLSLSTGDYFLIMGDDDKMDPLYLEEFLRLINEFPQLNVYHCRSTVIDEYSVPIRVTPSWPNFENVYDNIWHRINFHREQFISDFVFCSKNLKNNGGFYKLPLAWGTDDITVYRAASEKGIAHTNKSIFFYRSNSLSITSSGNNGLKFKANLAYFIWLKDFLTQPPNNKSDLVVYKSAINSLDTFYRKKQIHTLSIAMTNKFFINFYIFLKQSKTLGINPLYIIFAFFSTLNKKILKNII